MISHIEGMRFDIHQDQRDLGQSGHHWLALMRHYWKPLSLFARCMGLGLGYRLQPIQARFVLMPLLTPQDARSMPVLFQLAML
jgi:hypothetical protein